MLALESRGKVGDGRRGGRLRLDRGLAELDARDDLGGLLAGLGGGDGVAVLADGDALRTAEGAGLDDVELAAVGIDADPEAGEVVVPEDGVLAVDRETVHDSLGEGVPLGPGHGGALLGEMLREAR